MRVEVTNSGADALFGRDRLRAFRVALLRFAWREGGDPLAEEVLAREGHDVG